MISTERPGEARSCPEVLQMGDNVWVPGSPLSSNMALAGATLVHSWVMGGPKKPPGSLNLDFARFACFCSNHCRLRNKSELWVMAATQSVNTGLGQQRGEGGIRIHKTLNRCCLCTLYRLLGTNSEPMQITTACHVVLTTTTQREIRD